MKRFHHWQAWALTALGLWLLVSPAALAGFVPDSPARIGTQLAGAVALVLGLEGFVRPGAIDRWIQLALGIGPGRRTLPRPGA